MFWKRNNKQTPEKLIKKMQEATLKLHQRITHEHELLVDLHERMMESDSNLQKYYKYLEEYQNLLNNRISRIEDFQHREHEVAQLVNREIPWYAKFFFCCIGTVNLDGNDDKQEVKETEEDNQAENAV